MGALSSDALIAHLRLSPTRRFPLRCIDYVGVQLWLQLQYHVYSRHGVGQSMAGRGRKLFIQALLTHSSRCRLVTSFQLNLDKRYLLPAHKEA